MPEAMKWVKIPLGRHAIFTAIIFVQNSSWGRQEEYLGIYIADFEQIISDDIVWRMLEGISS